MGTRERRERSDQIDGELSTLFHDALSRLDITENNIALTAVGGYGRGELSPGSDLDILLLHAGLSPEKLKEFVNAFLYPLWSTNRKVDYSLRTKSETLTAAQDDIKVTLGLLDIRHICGNANLTDDVASSALEQWQKEYKKNLPKLRASLDERHERAGELAYLLEPDLKEARGGLRDINSLRALARLDVIEVALDRVAAAESILMNVRDALHETSQRERDQLLFTEQDKVAALLNYADADALMLEVAKSARAVDYTASRTWDRIDRLERLERRSIFKRSRPVGVAKGLVAFDGELAIDEAYEIESDPALGLRAAAIAAQRGLHLTVDACVDMASQLRDLPTPWPRQSREDLVTLIGAGEHMIETFEALDQEGLIARWIPEWSHVRFLPQRNVLHRHTVDRHMLETAFRAVALTRKVHRPDLLLIAALFHDIGKGFPNKDHSDYGEELIQPLARRMGFDEEDVETLALMVKHHLLLSAVATRRDLDDPQTIAFVLAFIKDAQTLELLHALSIADGEATGTTAWSKWKAGLVQDLVNRCLAAMSGIAPAPQLELTPEQVEMAESGELRVLLTKRDENFVIEIISPDRTGLLSMVAAVLSISRLDVRSARTRTIGSSAVMTWLVALDAYAPEPTQEGLHSLLAKAFDREIDINKRIEERINNYRKYPGIPTAPPVVIATNDLATNATVVEVRTHDKPGVLFNVSRTISKFGVDIRAAIVATLGAEAFDTLYVTDLQGNALSEEKAKILANQVENYLLTL
ncbi:MAG: [protein-PII] uridylyltransferase [Actinomycetes bacterium]